MVGTLMSLVCDVLSMVVPFPNWNVGGALIG